MKQATVKLPSGEFCFHEVQELGSDFKSYYKPLLDCTYFDWLTGGANYSDGVVISGNWQLLGADPTRLTEVEAGEIVESLTVQVEIPQRVAGFGWYTKFKNYQSDNQFSDSFWIPTASLDSLAASLGVSKPYVILKNKTDNNDK